MDLSVAFLLTFVLYSAIPLASCSFARLVDHLTDICVRLYSYRPPAEFIPPVQDPYQYIIFRASEVKDLAVDEQPPPQQNIHNDPAVLNVRSVFAHTFTNRVHALLVSPPL